MILSNGKFLERICRVAEDAKLWVVFRKGLETYGGFLVMEGFK